MVITYNAGTNIITVTGYTIGAPCTFLDIYNADVAGGWGVVSRQCNNQFCFDAGLQIGDGSTPTWFVDLNKFVQFNVFNLVVWVTTYRTAVKVMPNANAIFGESMSASDKIGKNGCSLYFSHAIPSYKFCIIAGGSGNLKLYGCYIDSNIAFGVGGDAVMSPVHTGDLIIWGSLVSVPIHAKSANTDLGNVVSNALQKASSYSVAVYATMTILNQTSWGTRDFGAFATTGAHAITVKNPVIKDADNILYITGSGNIYIINADTNTWTFNRIAGRVSIVYRQYEFDLKVQDEDENAINGAIVKIWDKDNNLVADTTTGADGKITTQTLTFGYYNEVGGSTPVMQTPHKIQIRKAGTNYLTYETDFTINKKTDWVIMMVDMSEIIDEINANEVKIDAIEVKLDSPDNFKADVSDLAKEVTVEDVKVRIDDLEVLGIQKQ